MRNTLQILLLLIAFQLVPIFAQVDSNCNWKDKATDSNYNFKSLQKEGGWKIKDYGTTDDSMFGIKIIFNFCQELTPKCNLDGSIVHAGVYEALEVLGQETDTCEVLGKYDSQEISTIKYGEQPAVNFTYTKGDLCIGSENSAEDGKERKASLIIICGSEANEWIQSPVNGASVTKCSKEFVIKHPAGCAAGAAPAGGSGGSFWSWIIIIALVYFIGGFVYNTMAFGAKGMDAIPHVGFWMALPELIVLWTGHAFMKAKTIIKGSAPRQTGGSGPKTSGGYLNL